MAKIIALCATNQLASERCAPNWRGCSRKVQWRTIPSVLRLEFQCRLSAPLNVLKNPLKWPTKETTMEIPTSVGRFSTCVWVAVFATSIFLPIRLRATRLYWTLCTEEAGAILQTTLENNTFSTIYHLTRFLVIVFSTKECSYSQTAHYNLVGHVLVSLRIILPLYSSGPFCLERAANFPAMVKFIV